MPSRGVIYDRNGEKIVENQPVYNVYVVPFECKNDTALILLSRLLGDSTQIIQDRIKQSGRLFSAVKVWDDISFAQLVAIEERKFELPGTSVQVDTRRKYTSRADLAHVLGYLSEASEADIEQDLQKQTKLGDWVGKKGVEKKYQKELLGMVGVNFIEVNALGREINDKDFAGEMAPKRGKDMYLTVDLDLQVMAESLFVDKQGGVVMLDARNGDALVLCSKPDYDPRIFSKRISNTDWRTLVNDPAKPMFDRVVQGEFPPGSTYKLVVLAAALETGIAVPDDKYNCTGLYRFGRGRFHCWNHSGHGTLDMYGAIKNSCNVYMYNVSLDMDVNVWAEYSKRFGFGQATGIDLYAEGKGNVPDKAYLDKAYGENGWTKAMMLNLGIGQGDLLVTPLQMAQFAMIMANKGYYFAPHMMQKFVDPIDGSFVLYNAPRKTVEGISETTFDVLRKGMDMVVNDVGGTGRASFNRDYKVAGKTGTAQNPHGESHAWFIGFAPFEEPQVAFCVFVENGGSGGGNAAPIAGKLLKKYFEMQTMVADFDS